MGRPGSPERASYCAAKPTDSLYYNILCVNLGLAPWQLETKETGKAVEWGRFGASKLPGAAQLSMDLLVRATGTVTDLRQASLTLLNDLGRSIKTGSPPPDLETFRTAFRNSVETRYGRMTIDFGPRLGVPEMPLSPFRATIPIATNARLIATALSDSRSTLRGFDAQAAARYADQRRLADERQRADQERQRAEQERLRQEQLAREAEARQRQHGWEQEEARERQEMWNSIGAATGTLMDTYIRSQTPSPSYSPSPPPRSTAPYAPGDIYCCPPGAKACH
jgi:hypothetical protein